MIGMDLVKDEDVLLAAYDDAAGVTAAFNLNLLARISALENVELPLLLVQASARLPSPHLPVPKLPLGADPEGREVGLDSPKSATCRQQVASEEQATVDDL